MHPVYVFVRQSEDGLTVPVKKMNNTGSRSARERAADALGRVHGTAAPERFTRVRVQDLKHTFCRRLRAAGVSFEDRQDLLGHKSQRITTHYSHPELSNLIEAAESMRPKRYTKFPDLLAISPNPLGMSAATRI
jgi:integrase